MIVLMYLLVHIHNMYRIIVTLIIWIDPTLDKSLKDPQPIVPNRATIKKEGLERRIDPYIRYIDTLFYWSSLILREMYPFHRGINPHYRGINSDIV